MNWSKHLPKKSTVFSSPLAKGWKWSTKNIPTIWMFWKERFTLCTVCELIFMWWRVGWIYETCQFLKSYQNTHQILSSAICQCFKMTFPFRRSTNMLFISGFLKVAPTAYLADIIKWTCIFTTPSRDTIPFDRSDQRSPMSRLMCALMLPLIITYIYFRDHLDTLAHRCHYWVLWSNLRPRRTMF